MNSSNQERILGTIDRFCGAVAAAVGREPFDYDAGMQFLRAHGNKTLNEVMLEAAKAILPDASQESTLSVETISAHFEEMDTRAKAAAILARLPDPNPKDLDKTIREIDRILPSVRKILASFAKQLPPDPGGPPRKVKEEDEPKIRDEVAELFKNGHSLASAKKEVARLRGASLSTIQRICRRGTTENLVPIQATNE